MAYTPIFGDKSSTFKFFLFLFLFLIWTILGSLVASGVLLVNGSSSSAMLWAQGISALCMFVMPPVCHYLLTRTNPLVEMGLRRTKVISFLIVILLIITSMPFISWLTEWNQGFKLPESLATIEQNLRAMEDLAEAELDKMLNIKTIWGLMGALVVVALIAAVGEEMTFRGVIQPWLVKVCRNSHVGIVLGAVIFSAIHFQFYGFVPRFVLGLLLGYVAYISNSLWPSMLLHFINNGTVVVATYLTNNGIIDIDVDTVGATNAFLTVLSAIATIAIIVYIWRKKDICAITNTIKSSQDATDD